jgi:hypothetical protein
VRNIRFPLRSLAGFCSQSQSLRSARPGPPTRSKDDADVGAMREDAGHPRDEATAGTAVKAGTRTAGRLAHIASLPPPPWELGDDAEED